jgi:hypothetical protein
MTRHLTFANVTSVLALTVSLGTGTAFAADKLPKNSVTSKSIKNGAVTGKDVKNASVTGKDVKDGSLSAADFAAGQLPVTLYAAVIDNGAGVTASLGVNKGALSVSDPAGQNDGLSPYVVTFNRSLSGCVANATVGRSNSSGNATIGAMDLEVSGSTVEAFSFSSTSGLAQDISFMVSVYC